MNIQSEFLHKNRPLVIAHRGNSSLYPENTIQAFEDAVFLNVDVLETDVRLTKDNKLVLFHDETLDRISNATGHVQDHSLEQLLNIDIGYNYSRDGKSYPFRGKGFQIMELKNLFEAFPEMKFNIDIKNTVPKAAIELAKLISNYKINKNIWVSSFHPEQMYRFRKLLPNVLTGASPTEIRKFLMNMKLRTLFRIKPNYQGFQVPLFYEKTKIITPKFIEKAHQRGLAVMVWTINDKSTMEWLIDLKIDGIFTDTPVMMMNVLKERNLL